MENKYQPFWFSEAIAAETQLNIRQLENQIQSDICIVGGGYTGLWTALQLKKKQPSLNIVLIEKELCGSGASGRNGGCMIPLTTKFSTMKKIIGERDAMNMVTASESALFKIKDFCDEHNIDAQIRIDGGLYTATNKTHEGVLDNLIQNLKTSNINSLNRMPKAEIQKKAGSLKHIDGYFSPLSGSLQPGLLVRGMKKVAEKKGVIIYENTAMINLEENNKIVINTKKGSITCNKLVIAINAWTPRHFPFLSRSVILVSSDMIISDRIPEQLHRIGLKDGIVVLDSCLFTHYYRTTHDGRLMFGKGGNLFSFNNKVVDAYNGPSLYEKFLKNSFKDFFPSLSEIPIIKSWNGPSERTKTGFPFFGYLKNNKNIVYGFGYSGNGILPSYVGGDILSDMILEEDNHWTKSNFCKGPLDFFPPEPFRWIGAMTIRNAVRRKEKAENMGLEPWWIDTKLAKLATSVGRLDKTSY